VEVQLNGGQFKPDFLTINPFHHVPVLVDDGFNIVESLAILDYLEAKYPTPAMLPSNPKDLAIVKMVQLATINELLPTTNPLLPLILGFPGGDPEKIAQAQQKISTVLKFFESLLDNRPYFGSDNITLAEPVAGTIISWLPGGGISLNEYPKLSAWRDRVTALPSWQKTEPSAEAFAVFKSIMAARMGQGSSH
jgi:glutathione S-transferase